MPPQVGIPAQTASMSVCLNFGASTPTRAPHPIYHCQSAVHPSASLCTGANTHFPQPALPLNARVCLPTGIKTIPFNFHQETKSAGCAGSTFATTHTRFKSTRRFQNTHQNSTQTEVAPQWSLSTIHTHTGTWLSVTETEHMVFQTLGKCRPVTKWVQCLQLLE